VIYYFCKIWEEGIYYFSNPSIITKVNHYDSMIVHVMMLTGPGDAGSSWTLCGKKKKKNYIS